MKFFISTSLLLLLTAATTAWSAVAQPALWRVDVDGGRGRAYLFGSVHFGAQAMYPLSSKVLKAFSDSELLAVELDADLIDGKAVDEVFRRMGHYPAGQALSEKLSAADWEKLLRVAEPLGLSESQLERLKPWVVAMQLTASQIREQGFSAQLGIDHYFLKLAKTADYETDVVQLETLEQQLAVVDGLPEEQQVDFLLQALEQSQSGTDLLSDIVKAWCAGDEQRLEQLVLDTIESVDDDSLHHQVFVQRNNLMLEKIYQSLLAGQRLFVVVGAGHIVGEHGLRSMLSSNGFQVTRVQ